MLHSWTTDQLIRYLGASEKALASLRDARREDREDLKTQRPIADKENKPIRSSRLNDIDPEGWLKIISLLLSSC